MRQRVLVAVVSVVMLATTGGCGGSGSSQAQGRGAADPPAATRSAVVGEGGAGPLDKREDTNSPGAGRGAGPIVSDDNVVGGLDIKIAELPWTVALVYPGSTSNFCGGVLVSLTRVLTAAHCVEGKKGQRQIIGPDAVAVLMGRTSLTDQSTGQEVAVSRVWQSDRYNPGTYAWDYAVIDLATPVAGPAVRLPSRGRTDLWQPGMTAVVAGWGCEYQNGGPPETCEQSGGSPLKAAFLTARPASACGNGFDPSSGWCLASRPGFGVSCAGDSGGPYVVLDTDDVWTLVGLVSYGPENCPIGEPEVASFVPSIMSADAFFLPLGWNFCASGTSCPKQR